MLDLPGKSPRKLKREQQKAFEAMRDLLGDLPEADRRYDALKQSKSGLVISTDIARYLDARYAAEPKKGKARDLDPSWDPAWRYGQDRLVRETGKRGKQSKELILNNPVLCTIFRDMSTNYTQAPKKLDIGVGA